MSDKAEIAIYRQMVSSFSRSNQATAYTLLPTGWEEGTGLVVFHEYLDPQQPGQPVYQEITGTVTSFDPGKLTITADDGQNYILGGAATYFDWWNVDMNAFTNPPSTDVGAHLFAIAQPLASGQYKAVYMAFEQDSVWQPSTYQAFYDLRYESLPVSLSAYFPPNEPHHIWLRGTPAQLAPYLVASASEEWASQLVTATEILTWGTLTSITSSQYHGEKLYVLAHPCLSNDSKAEVCPAWQQQFPPVPATVITATVASLLPESEGFLLSQPSNGFIQVQLSQTGQVLNSGGQAITWADVSPGMSIRATGKLDGAGILKAEEVVLLGDG
jgi:hypothetical protein